MELLVRERKKVNKKKHSAECFFLFEHAIFLGDSHKIKVTK
ncbi:hypothetical protein COD09_13095 [Bacillus cereus]|uniref:Uncharacterized protein n=1 Tax=Bacillus cereus TaxID=1396 RepID=A0A2C1DP11_BACCE|nr:hypothetical protein COD09_13095 [Bacillus cereus]